MKLNVGYFQYAEHNFSHLKAFDIFIKMLVIKIKIYDLVFALNNILHDTFTSADT